MVDGKRAVARCEFRATAIRKLLSMQLYWKVMRAGGIEDTRSVCSTVKPIVSQKASTASAKLLSRDLRKLLAAYPVDVSVLVAVRLRRQRMRAEERANDAHVRASRQALSRREAFLLHSQYRARSRT